MTSTRRNQFALPTLLAVMTVVPLWLYWAETVVNYIEEAKQREAAAASIGSGPAPVVVFPIR
jgi:hypothetical protein